MKQNSSRRVFPLAISLLGAVFAPLGCAADDGAPLDLEEEVSEAQQELVSLGLFVISNNTIWKRGAIGPGTGNDWTGLVADVYGVTGMAVHEGELYVIASNYLYKRESLSSGSWVVVGEAYGGTALASFDGSLYMTTSNGLFLRGATGPGTGNDWTYVGEAYAVTAMAAYNGSLYAVSNDALWKRGAIGPGTGNDWSYAGDAYAVTGMGNYNGSLYVASNSALWKRGAIGPGTGSDWSYAGDAYGVTSMAATPKCPSGQTLVSDLLTCVTLTPWANQTELPAGSKIAIRLRRVMTNYYGGSEVWTKWIGVSASDNQTIDAVDVDLTSRNIFTATTYRPGGQPYYDLPWYNMLASNGNYVGGSNDGTGRLLASHDLANAGMFGRGWNSSQASEFMLEPYPWGQRDAWLNRVKTQGGYYELCLSPFTLGTAHITQWLNGGYPNYGCYVSGDVDYFVVN
ncbi:hypothetical protein [Polyangium fumosum]|uniref:Uncharacterized protein n=1 Tax=Polyangium fumosum TaxID=889272 RepID=A0A4U1IH75_9BACT|nr:hypothetical protein [Polyangium fumosum]TKC93057.1 hypothetical protein E8A74_49880 [Polyangium fumosum]